MSRRAEKITHEIIVDVDSGTCSVTSPLEIPQGDINSHVLLVKLRNSEGEVVSLNEETNLRLTFVKDDEYSTTYCSDLVEIVNPYRGVISCLIGSSFVKQSGRYTAYLDIGCGCPDCGSYSVSFVVTVTSSHQFTPGSKEVAMSEEFYEEVKEHLEDESRHVDDFDKKILKVIKDNYSKFLELLGVDPSISCNCPSSTCNCLETNEDLKAYVDSEVDKSVNDALYYNK